MSYFGAYFGAVTTLVVTVPEDPGPPLVEAAVTTESPEYVDHTEQAIARLPQYAKAKTS